MNTTITELNTINHYRSAFNVIRDFFPEELDKLTDDQRAELDSFDDYEDFGYTVINYDTMVMDTDGHVVSIESLQGFLQHTLDYLREGDEPEEEPDDDEPHEPLFTVQIVSPGGIRHDLYGSLTEREAIDFCDEHNWTWLDENCFEWNLDYVEN